MTYLHISNTSMKICKYTVPDYATDLCSGSCENNIKHLMRRADCHAIDPKCIKLFNCDRIVMRIKETICLVVNINIIASMKDHCYNTTVAFGTDGLLSCAYNCPCDDDGKVKLVCIHAASASMTLPLLLFDGLAEHLLTKLAVMGGGGGGLLFHHLANDIYFQTKYDFITLVPVVNYNVFGFNTIKYSLTKMMIEIDLAKVIPPPPPHNHVYYPLFYFKLKVHHFKPYKKCWRNKRKRNLKCNDFLLLIVINNLI